ncbi:MAG: bifunctional proline dehydrogenase/L-glutamate gamma-semialdehyde dehydrogenase, partial [Syntrophobacteraceae bacterium]|nr:bifunctional proline dehydrogenase/L-glutamate gamma-semialdehyde dehydrogenase [Syntrophobacteraceae bacterium]
LKRWVCGNRGRPRLVEHHSQDDHRQQNHAQHSRRAIIPGEEEPFSAYLEKRRQEGVRTNINYLGEAVLGEEESAKRLSQYIKAMQSPDIEYISVKISTIYSQIHPIAFEHSLDILKERLSTLYRIARDNTFIRKDGTRVPKFVNLDMEEYRDLEITLAAFTQTLDQEDLLKFSAGIVLQAYIPDSYTILRQLTQWARGRVDRGGGPITVRIVKGANMEMEQVEAALHNWPLAPYDNKLDVDANYKRMVDFGMQPENIRAVRLGIASHNLFELAYARKVAERRGVTDSFTFEMLEGMADHVRRAIQETTDGVLVYAPVAGRKEFINGIAYLIRRLDENTSEENFLRYIPRLQTNSREWAFLKDQFVASYEHRDKAGTRPHRSQNRLTELFNARGGTYWDFEFVNEPDTDWSLAANRQWADKLRKKWKKRPSDDPVEIPVVVGGEEIFSERETRDCMDPSQYGDDVCVARFALANDEDVDRAVAVAKADPDGWRSLTQTERHAVLSRVAMELRRARGDLIGVAAASTGKVFTETDVEVSEAIDFAEFYPYSARAFTDLPHLKARGKGVGLVISPWNFPMAIPCGGITALLAAGNTVLFKPSSDAVLVAWRLCQCFWEAGVSQNVLQFVPCSGAGTGARLTGHQDVDTLILTGGTE